MTETQEIAARAERAGARYFVERGRAWYGALDDLDDYTLTLLLADWPRIEALLLAERGADRAVLAECWADDTSLWERFPSFEAFEAYASEEGVRIAKAAFNSE